MFTEAEAHAKWCPFAPVTSAEMGAEMFGEYGKYNSRKGQGATRCIGSACMAWRWAGEFEDARTKATAAAGAYPPGVLDERGYCGLAGKP